MGEMVRLMAATGILPVLLGVVIAFGGIAVYFGFIKKS